MLTNETITFGKYKNLTLGHILKDRNYCKWLEDQEWFKNGYEYLYNRILDYKPLDFFIKNNNSEEFIDSYIFFNLYNPEEIELPLSDSEMMCYTYYIELINNIKQQIYTRIENEEENKFDIKAPKNWLKTFELKYGMPRQEFKFFLSSYELPNIPYIIERVKKQGGIEYKGAKSFLIAKKRSEEQEKWWENILKEKYGEKIGTQFKYHNCIFDFINISNNTIYECKLGLKDFNEEQHDKYSLTLNKYNIIYLISKDTYINMNEKVILTSNPELYTKYIEKIPLMKSRNYLDILITNFKIINVENISTII